MARGKRSREADPVVWGCLLARLPFLYQPEVYRKELPGFVGAGDKSTSVVRGRDGGRHEYHQGRRHTGGGGGGGDRIAARRLCIVTITKAMIAVVTGTMTTATITVVNATTVASGMITTGPGLTTMTTATTDAVARRIITSWENEFEGLPSQDTFGYSS